MTFRKYGIVIERASTRSLNRHNRIKVFPLHPYRRKT